tara:strand:- start:43180 stop:43527 length:348 start_codon:yes stop_codon:yes gene_type:complete
MRQFSKKVKKDIRDKVIPVRFTAEERDFVEIISTKFNISFSEFIRRSALQRRMPAQTVSEVNRKTYQELCRIGNNINQIVRHLNSGIFLRIDKKIFTELKALIKKIGFEVIGSKA